MILSLTNQEWVLKGYWPWVPLKDKSMETGKKLIGTTDWIPATVPGGVHYDLYRAGLIEHPYYEMNSLKCEWVEHRWWMYKTTFPSPSSEGERFELIFKGIDYEALFYLNGEYLGEHKGMYHPAAFDITSFIKENELLELIVVFKHPPDEMGQIGKTSETFTQKSRFNYKWDFSTRLVNIGFWDDISIKIHQKVSFENVSLTTTVEDGKGLIDIEANLSKLSTFVDHMLILEAFCTDASGKEVVNREFHVERDQNKQNVSLTIDHPDLWYPNGHGDQPLYKIELRLMDSEHHELDQVVYYTGIRKLEFTQNEASPKEALPYTVQVNGKKIYIKGFNMTPIDHLYGNVTKEHYEFLVKKIKRANANMVRVWGGGIIEKELFYDLCDQHGIMVWQEFIQSSSGIDNIPSKKPEFLSLLKMTAISALKEKRNHVCLTVWSGGNELMDEAFKPSTYDDETIAMLKELVDQLDPSRLFLPTSASGPVEFVTKEKGVSHDVHGHWQYIGNPSHYELYGESDSLFHSEFGTDGVSALKSLKKFLSPKNLVPTTMSDHIVWRHHGEWWGTYLRDQELFGEITEISQFVACSQWVQAEGLRFILEANRRRAFKNSGSLIWQLNEPWPNASCTNLVDYYGEEKMAYYWAKNAFSPQHVSLDYRKLNYPVGEIFKETIYAHGNGEYETLCIRTQVLNSFGNLLLQEDYDIKLDSYTSIPVADLAFQVSPQHGELFFVRLQLLNEEQLIHENLYIFSTRNEWIYSPALHLKKAKLSVKPIGDWAVQGSSKHRSRTFQIENTGDEVALHVSMTETTNTYWMEPSMNFITLFPGEKRQVKIDCLLKEAGGFLQDDCPHDLSQEVDPQIHFHTFTDLY